MAAPLTLLTAFLLAGLQSPAPPAGSPGAALPLPAASRASLEDHTARAHVFADPDWFHWGGSVARGDDGAYHLFYSRWPRAAERGMRAWLCESEIARATADRPEGPFVHQEVVLRGFGQPQAERWDAVNAHNPCVVRMTDPASGRERWYLYFIANRDDDDFTRDGEEDDWWDHVIRQRIGVAVADSPEGPWTRHPRPVIEPPQGPLNHYVVNPAVTQLPDGRFLLLLKSRDGGPGRGRMIHAWALADRPEGPFVAQDSLLFPAELRAEDPCVWVEGEWVFAAVKDWEGQLSGTPGIAFVRGRMDGARIAWELPADNSISPRSLRWSDGEHTPLRHLERPFVLRDAAGRPTHLYAAACVGDPFAGGHADGPGPRLPFTVCLPLAPVGATEGPASPAAVLVEAEAFEHPGGWLLDQQFMDLMGSPYLLAHGMGRPVEDARTAVTLPAAGRHRVWVRTRDWVAPWGAEGAPGRFQLLLDGAPLAVTFGTEGAEWHWQDGGVVELGERVELALHDLTGFEGRADAVLLTPDLGFRPPDSGPALEALRRELLGLPAEPTDGGSFDLVVVGGGLAGTAAAVTAARLGLSVALVQDRPVLGGNASSEVRVWPEGHVNQRPWPRVGDVVMELVPERRADSKNAQAAAVFDDARKLRVARAEERLQLFLEQRVDEVGVDGARIASVVCEDVRTAARTRVRGRWFLDSTGDGAVGFLAGADHEITATGHMGASNLWNIQCLCEDEDPLSAELAAATEEARFPRTPWAHDLSDKPFPGRTSGSTEPQAGAAPISLGNWFWESGFDRDPIADMELVRDNNFRAMYGAWDAIKNVEGRYPAHRLNWVAHIAGKRESRRLLGDVVLSADDLRDGVEWPDGCFPCTWGIDTHHPDPRYAEGHEGNEFIADFTRGAGYEYEGPYWAPYRCLYSRNVPNLFMAGRDISVTHEALGAVRVMKTTGAMGEIVGMAAAVCAREGCDPREVYTEHLAALRELMAAGAGRVEPVTAGADGSFTLPAADARTSGRSIRYEAERDSLGWWRAPGDTAGWAVELPRDGGFRVELLLACAPGEEGGAYRVTAGISTLSGRVPATASWEDYQLVVAGELELAAGTLRITLTNDKPDGPLMKLRAVRLVPR